MNREILNNEIRKNVFCSRNFCLVFLGALVSELGALLYNFAVSFYILEISDTNAALQGLYLALCGIAMLIFTPVGGVLGDRFNKAKIMYVCDFLKGGLIILASLLMLLFRTPASHIVILFALGISGNAVSGIFTPASNALFPHIVDRDQLQQANSYFAVKSSLESILGIILAGVLYAAVPVHTLFLVVGICFTASGISEMMIRYDHHPSPERLTFRLAVRDMYDGVVYLRERKAVMVLLGAVLFINFFFAPVTGNFIPYFIKTELADAPSYLLHRVLTPELWSSVFNVCFGISSLLGAAILSARAQEEKCGHKTAARLCIYAVVMAAMTICYWQFVDRGVSLNGFLIVLCVSGLAMGFLISLINIPVSTVMMRVIDQDKLSKVTSITSIGSQGMIPAALVLAGLVLESAGCTPLLVICSLGFSVTAVLLLASPRIGEL